MEAKRFGDDRCGGLLDELTKRGDPGIDERETESAEGLEQGAVGDGLAREPPGEQPRAAVIAPSAVGDEAVEQRRDGWRDGAWWVAEAQVALAVDVTTSSWVRRKMRLSGWA